MCMAVIKKHNRKETMAEHATGNGSRSRQRAAAKGRQRSKLVKPRRGQKRGRAEEEVLGQARQGPTGWTTTITVGQLRLVCSCLSRLDLFLFLLRYFAALFYDFLNKQTHFYDIPIWANKRASTTRAGPGLIGTPGAAPAPAAAGIARICWQQDSSEMAMAMAINENVQMA